VRNLVLVVAVIIHAPDFLMPAAGADEINLGFGNALNAAAETINDFVGEFMGNHSGGIVGCTVLVLLA
jgi:hypothetical protein